MKGEEELTVVLEVGITGQRRLRKKSGEEKKGAEVETDSDAN